MGSGALPLPGGDVGYNDPLMNSYGGGITSSGGLSNGAQGVINGLGQGFLGGLGNLFGGNPGSTTTTNSKSSANGNFSTTPTYSSAVLPLYNQLLSSYMGLANGSTTNKVLSGYQSQGLQGINQAAQGGQNSLNQILAQRGLSNSPVAGNALVQNELSRQQQATSLNNSLPLLQQQMNLQNLGAAGNFFSNLPTGQSGTQSSNSTTDSTQTVKPNKQSFWGGLLSGAMSALPALLAL